jgi:hypothetical protein
MLSQRQGDGGMRVIAYYSWKLSAPETKYPAYDRELLALKETMLAWHFFTQGNHVLIHTHHRALEQILRQRSLSSRQFGALVAISSFKYDIKYVKGANNIVADQLSRRADHESEHDLLLLEGALMSVTVEAVADGATVEWLQRVRAGYEEDEWLGPVRAVLEGKVGSWLPGQLRKAASRQRRFQLEDGLLVKESCRIAIPGIDGLRETLCSEYHDTPLGGHFGKECALLALTRGFTGLGWRGLSQAMSVAVMSITA